jgi:hypothetical protein
MRRAPILALALLVGCPPPGGTDAGSVDAGPPSLELGTGESSFVPVVDGGEIELVHGPQGGWHAVGAVRMSGFDPDATVLTYTVVDAGTAVVEVPIAILARRLVRDGVAYLKLGDLLIFPITGPADVVGHTVEIRASVTRDGVEIVSDVLDVTVVDRL